MAPTNCFEVGSVQIWSLSGLFSFDLGGAMKVNYYCCIGFSASDFDDQSSASYSYCCGGFQYSKYFNLSS